MPNTKTLFVMAVIAGAGWVVGSFLTRLAWWTTQYLVLTITAERIAM